MISATKHITHGQETTGVSITVRVSDDEIWQASYDQDEMLDTVIDMFDNAPSEKKRVLL